MVWLREVHPDAPVFALELNANRTRETVATLLREKQVSRSHSTVYVEMRYVLVLSTYRGAVCKTEQMRPAVRG